MSVSPIQLSLDILQLWDHVRVCIRDCEPIFRRVASCRLFLIFSSPLQCPHSFFLTPSIHLKILPIHRLGLTTSSRSAMRLATFLITYLVTIVSAREWAMTTDIGSQQLDNDDTIVSMTEDVGSIASKGQCKKTQLIDMRRMLSKCPTGLIVTTALK